MMSHFGDCLRKVIDSAQGGAVGRLLGVAMLSVSAPQAAAAPDTPGITEQRCPPGAIAIEPVESIQDTADRAGDGAAFCLKNGVHRMQVVRPKPGQSFYGEGAVLNGSRLLTTFSRERRLWVATGQEPLHRPQHPCAKAHTACYWCAKDAPACDLPEGLFVDDKPLTQVLSKEDVEPGRFYFDHSGARIYLADDPTGRKIEVAMALFAFESRAPNVLIRNLTIEKYASAAQHGAVHAQHAVGWIVENCEVRLNSGAGIGVGTGTQVRNCDIHHNGQIGITGVGSNILIEGNRIWANNIRGFEPGWEAGGVKLSLSDDAILRGNHVHDNVGPGLWCDGDCHNVLYAGNLIERNHGAGIYHEIAFSAVIRNNILRHNGIAEKEWFWGSDIIIAASQDVEVYGNKLILSPGKCGVMLIDQGRPLTGGGTYKTRDNNIHDNEMIFEGAPCAGGASDVKPGEENFAIITDGNNVFDRNVYRIRRASGPGRFPWGRAIFDWNEVREKGLEPNGRLVFY